MLHLKLVYLFALSTYFPSILCEKKVIIQKCCPQDKKLNIRDDGLECVDLDKNEMKLLADFWWWLPRSEMDEPSLDLLHSGGVIYRQPSCDQTSVDLLRYKSLNNSEFSFYADGPELRLDVLKGSTFHDDTAMRDDSFPAEAYCVDAEHGQGHAVLLCPCSKHTCVRQCCSRSSVYNHSMEMCATVPPDRIVNGRKLIGWMPKVENKTDYYKLFFKIPDCKKLTVHELQDSENGSQLLLMNDGSIKTLDGSHEHIPKDKYCATYNSDNREEIIFCMKMNMEQFWKQKIYGVLFLIGAFCLLLTIIVTLLLPEMRRNIHGKMAVAHNVMLCIGYLVNSISQLRGSNSSRTSCEAMSVVIQFTILAAFFWLNVMCIDIAWTFSGLRPIQGTALQRDRKKFIYYSLYAWGSTAIISMVTLIVEYSPTVTRFKPNFGERMCFFNDKAAELLFFFGPMALLLCVNLALFGYTAYKIIAVKKETSILCTGDSSTNTKNKQTLILYVKLFCLMGVTWVTEVISWAVGGPSYLWYFTDIINLLRAVFIFVIFCCKRSVYNMLRKRVLQYLGREPLDRTVSRGARSNHSNSSCTRTTAATSTTPNAKRKFSTQSQKTEELEMSRIPLKSKDSIHDSNL